MPHEPRLEGTYEVRLTELQGLATPTLIETGCTERSETVTITRDCPQVDRDLYRIEASDRSFLQLAVAQRDACGRLVGLLVTETEVAGERHLRVAKVKNGEVARLRGFRRVSQPPPPEQPIPIARGAVARLLYRRLAPAEP